MSRINLSGISALNIPPSVFDEWVKFNENHYSNAAHPEGCEVWADVVWDSENYYQTEKEPALVVKLDNCPVGYIPVLSTIERYVNEAWAARGEAMIAMDADAVNMHYRRWEKEQERYKWAKIVRDLIETDLFTNHIPVRVKVGNVLISDSGQVLSVSVDYVED